MTGIIIDFETRSELDLTKVGPWVYSKHSSTEILCVSYIKGKRKTCESFLDIKEFVESIYIDSLPEGELHLEAHNAFFEKCIWTNTLPKYDINNRLKGINILWSCSAARAAYNGLPRSLAGAAQAAGLSVNKDAEGRVLMLKMCKPRKPTKNNPNKWHETPKDLKRLSKYCDQDVIVESQLSRTISQLSTREKLVWDLDQRMNQRGLPIDLELARNAIELAEAFVEERNQEVKRLTNDELDGVTKRQKVMDWCAQYGVELTSYATPYIEDIIKTKLPENVRQILNIRLQLSKTSVAKYKAVVRMTDDKDCRLRGALVYNGCFTGRWSGSGFQPQNLPRGENFEMEQLTADIKDKSLDTLQEKYQDPLKALSTAVRGVICAPEGKTLFCVDYSAIECRALLWLAQDKRALDMIASGKDLYIDMAASIFNIKYEEVTKAQRQLGKTAILGLGYGMGANKFYNTCNIPGVNITQDFAEVIVKKYRHKYKSITRLWKLTEIAFKNCVNKYSISDIPESKYFYFKSKHRVCCKLPSGRNLIYAEAKVVANQIQFRGVDSKTKLFTDRRTWGGELVQNATQAIARDILAEAMLRVDKEYPVILTVHDEIVSEVNESQIDQFDKFLELVKEAPRWGDGLLLDVEGWHGKRYHK